MAAESKKLPLLYSLICFGLAPSRSSAKSICLGIAPGGTVSVRVCFHKSHIKQRHGHSLLVTRIVPEVTMRPDSERSSSRKNPCGLNGSSVFRRGGRWAAIHARSSAGKTEVTTARVNCRWPEIAFGIRFPVLKVAGEGGQGQPRHVENCVWRRPAYPGRSWLSCRRR